MEFLSLFEIKQSVVDDLSFLTEETVDGIKIVEVSDVRLEKNEYTNQEPDVKVKLENGRSVYLVLASNVKQFSGDIDTVKAVLNDGYKTARKFQLAEEKKERELKEAEEQAKKDEIKKERAKQRLEETKKNQIKLVSNLGKQKVLVNDNYYVGLGYIAKHARRFVADMPDYLEDWFIRTFGNQEHKAYDQSILCPSGLPSHYALGFRIDLDTNENIPTSLIEHLSSQNKTNKPIADTSFIYDIVYNYNFKFGKKQDLDAIENSIPVDQIENFRLGFNA